MADEKVSVAVTPTLLKKIDSAAAESGKSRSEYVREILVAISKGEERLPGKRREKTSEKFSVIIPEEATKFFSIGHLGIFDLPGSMSGRIRVILERLHPHWED